MHVNLVKNKFIVGLGYLIVSVLICIFTILYIRFRQRNFANMESPSEGFANAVIQAHCSTLSDTSDGGWSTVLPLRHLHMSLVAITTDISKYVYHSNTVKLKPQSNSFSAEMTHAILTNSFLTDDNGVIPKYVYPTTVKLKGNTSY